MQACDSRNRDGVCGVAGAEGRVHKDSLTNYLSAINCAHNLPIPVHAAFAVVTVDVAFPPMFCLSLVLLVLAGCGFLQCLSNTLWMGIKIYRKLLIV